MITAIEIENFKGIGERVRVPLKPITLLFGANSSGKSTIVQAVHLAHEIFERHNLDPDRTLLGGDAVDLGGFANMVHGRDVRTAVRLAFEMDFEGKLDTYHDESLGCVEDMDGSAEISGMLANCSSATVEIEVNWNNSLAMATVGRYAIKINGQLLARLGALSETPQGTEKRLPFLLAIINFEHPLFNVSDEGGVTWRFSEFGSLTKELAAEGRHYALAPARESKGIIPSALPKWGQLLDLAVWPAPEEERPKDKYGLDISPSQENYLSRLALTELIVGPGEVLRHQLQGLRYLGPLREMPPRNYEPPRHPGASSWARGLAAWDALYLAEERVAELPSESPANVPAVAETAETAWGHDASWPAGEDEEAHKLSIEKVNEWLDDRLKAGYAVHRRSRTEVDTQAIPEGTADPKILRRFVEELKEGATKKQVVLVPHGQSIEVQPYDVGTGISQLLPVVVLALDARRSLVAIEQPELHLHPALQTELGDLFVESALASGNRLLIETHSEHLMLRLLRRIEETHSGEIPPGRWRLHPDQVSVVFVEQIDGAVRTTPLRIDETGEFIDRWPRGFFEERADELF